MKKLKIGLFAVNSDAGFTLSKHPNRHGLDWQTIKDIAIMADTSGYNYMVPLTRWLGHGGDSDPHGAAYETFTFASSIASITKNITVFSTILAPLCNPVYTARALMTIQHAGGRANGINMVCGWKQDEMDALGLSVDMDARYNMASEWVRLVKQLMTSDTPIDFSGDFYTVKGAYCRPKPLAIPEIAVAAFAPVGQDFARTHCHILFTMINNISTAKYRIQDMRGDNPDFKIAIPCFVICAKTDAQAQDIYTEWGETYADMGAIDNFAGRLYSNNPVNAIVQKQKIKQMAVGAGSYPLVGTPKRIADEITALYEAGIDITLFNFNNYVQDMPYFNTAVLPLLRSSGVL